ncbi:MAG: YdbL family protein [Francisellaceae bacterium]|jgi:uncharacterized protein|nr:YdbL family protein [Francisellaceae bacterium]MBT6207241.1 YdbL family protein [Francisellaceae bacterium]MBT6539418.1 YdbL family protein [Francisellaceae bacterium]
MIKQINTAILTVALSIIAMPCFAVSLQDAKAQNLVGEQSSGYLGTPSTPSTDISNLVQDVNARRKSEYERISASTNSSLITVESMAGQKALNDTPPGKYVNRSGQGWSLK